MTKFLDIFSNKKEEKEEKIQIIADNREKNSLVIAEIIKRGGEVKWEQLETGDYIVKDNLIERKTWNDFQSSIIDKRIEKQLEALKKSENPLIILEKNPEISITRIHESAIRGKILSIIGHHKIPIIQTENEQETAKYLLLLGKERGQAERSERPSRKDMTDKERQRFILEGFPGVGPITAKKLLIEHKTLKKIINAEEKMLQETLGKKASEFARLLEKEYSEEPE